MRKLLLNTMPVVPLFVFAVALAAFELIARTYFQSEALFFMGFLAAYFFIPGLSLMMDWVGNFVDKRREQ
jgi:hypothetical protein